MSALSVLYLVLSLPVAFILHDAEEVAVQHRWMLAHRESLASRFPKLRPMIERLSRLGTTAFAIAATEELVVLVVADYYFTSNLAVFLSLYDDIQRRDGDCNY